MKTNCYIGKKTKIKPKVNNEFFSFRKFIHGLNIFCLDFWYKAIPNFFKTILVAAIIGGTIFGVGYWRGVRDKPVITRHQDFIVYIEDKRGDTHKIEVRDHQLYFNDEKVRVKDVPSLRPYGIKITPKLFAGVGNIEDVEIGVGAEVAYVYDFNLDLFVTGLGIYAGISYDLDFSRFFQNSAIGVAIGRDWELVDNRFLIYWTLRF